MTAVKSLSVNNYLICFCKNKSHIYIYDIGLNKWYRSSVKFEEECSSAALINGNIHLISNCFEDMFYHVNPNHLLNQDKEEMKATKGESQLPVFFHDQFFLICNV